MRYHLKRVDAGFGIPYELDFCVADYVDAPEAASDALRGIWRAAKKRGVALATPREEIVLDGAAQSIRPLRSARGESRPSR